MKNIIKLLFTFIVTSSMFLLISYTFKSFKGDSDMIIYAAIFGFVWTIVEGYKMYRNK